MDEPIRIDVGYLCEDCLDPIEDGLAPEQDWRVPHGSRRHLCRACWAMEEAGTKHITANHRGDDPDTIGSFSCDCKDTIDDYAESAARKLFIAGEYMKSIDFMFKALVKK